MSAPRGTAGRRAPCWWGTLGWATVKPGGRKKQDKEISRGVKDNSLEPTLEPGKKVSSYLDIDSYITRVQRQQKAKHAHSHTAHRSITHLY